VQAREGRKEIQRAVEKVGGDERIFIPGRASDWWMASSDAMLDIAGDEGDRYHFNQIMEKTYER
jgi:hypothetical protein